VRPATAFLCVVFLAAAPALAGEYRLRVVAKVGDPSPAGGSFDRFSVDPLPVVTPVNGRGEVAFFARLVRAAAGEGLFLASRGRLVKIAAEGDRVARAGTITGFGKHPVPALNDAGGTAFHASLAGGRSVEGIFVGGAGRVPSAVVLSGQAATDIASGTFAAMEAPALNDRGEVAFLATVQRGRDTIDAVYLAAGGRLRKIVAQGDGTPVGGSFAAFGPPSVNNRGVVGFAAIVEGGQALGGLFLAEAPGRFRKVVATGDAAPLGGYFAKFSDRLSLNEANQVAFHALVNDAPHQGGIFVTADGGSTLVAALGGDAPGGGRFASFGLWPALAADGRVAFVAAIDGGSAPLGVFLSRPGGIEQVVAVGQASPAGVIPSFGLYPSLSINRAHAIAFYSVPTTRVAGAEAILVAEPAPR
jgi:hypothetical protein